MFINLAHFFPLNSKPSLKAPILLRLQVGKSHLFGLTGSKNNH